MSNLKVVRNEPTEAAIHVEKILKYLEKIVFIPDAAPQNQSARDIERTCHAVAVAMCYLGTRDRSPPESAEMVDGIARKLIADVIASEAKMRGGR